MTSRQLIPFRPEHIDLIDLREGQETVETYAEHVKAQGEYGLAVTLVINNRVIGCGGVASVLPHVGECWMVCGQQMAEYPMQVWKATRGMIDYVWPFYHRLQMAVRTDRPEAIAFARRLGFEDPQLLRKYDPAGNDYYLYARVK